MRPLFITGIGTGIGKTLISAILTEKFKADYWKPIQSGDLHQTDTDTVKNLVSNKQTKFHPEAYRLSQPFSPHKSADLDHIEIDLDKINLPVITKKLIVEGAGGLMVPLNKKALIIDLIQKLEAEVILVSKNYLGSINHTLLALEALQTRNIPLKGIIFNGERDDYSERFILEYSGIEHFARVDHLAQINKESIKAAADPIAFL